MAAEKVELFELNIDISKANADIATSNKNIKQLKDEIKELSKVEGDNSEAIAKKTVELKIEQTQLRTNTNLTKNAITANNANTGSIEQLRAKLAVTSVQWAKLSKEERINSAEGKRLTKQKLELTNALKKEEKATGDTRRNVGNYNEGVGQSIGLLGQFVPAVGRASTGAQALGRAFTVALGPIGLIVAAIGLIVAGLKAFFTAGEEGQDVWDKFAGAAEIALGNIQERLSDLTESIIEDPKGALNDFLGFLKNSFGKQLEGTIELIGASFSIFFKNINLGYQRLKGQFTENSKGIADAQKQIEEANNGISLSLLKIAEGAKNALDPVQDFYNETKKEVEENNKLLDRQAALNRTIRNAEIQNAKASLEVAKLRNQVAQAATFSAEERLKFLDEAIKLESEILKRNEFIATQEFNIAKARAEFSKNSREDNDALAKSEANIFRVREANFTKTKLLESQRATLLKQNADLARKLALDAVSSLESIASEEIRIQTEQDADLAALDKISRDEATKQKEQAKAQRLIEFEAEYAANQDNIFRTLELEAQGLELQRQQEISFAQSIGADTTNIEKKFAKASIQIEKTKQDAKLSLAADFSGNLATIFGEQTAIGKAAAIAETTINTYRSATAAYSSLAGIPVVGPALGIAAAAASVAAGIANVKKILSVKSGLPGDSISGVAVPSGSTPQSGTPVERQAPDVNQGIISRDTLVKNNDNIIVQPTLVIDEVDSKQNQQFANNQTSVV